MHQDDAVESASADDILQAVREVIAAEVERVGDPGPRPWDVEGWHAYAPLEPAQDADPEPDGAAIPRGPAAGAPGRPVHDPEAWRWFELVALAYLPELVLVEFAWRDPSTPDLHYVAAINVPTSTADFAASVVRSSLRGRLAQGWREQVQRTWLGGDRVLISRPARSPRSEDFHRRMQDERWHEPRRPPATETETETE